MQWKQNTVNACVYLIGNTVWRSIKCVKPAYNIWRILLAIGGTGEYHHVAMKTKHSKRLCIFDRKHCMTVYKMRQTCVQYLTYITCHWWHRGVSSCDERMLPAKLCISHHLNNCIAFPSHQTTSIFHRIVPSAKKINPFYEYDIFCNIFQWQKKKHVTQCWQHKIACFPTINMTNFHLILKIEMLKWKPGDF